MNATAGDSNHVLITCYCCVGDSSCFSCTCVTSESQCSSSNDDDGDDRSSYDDGYDDGDDRSSYPSPPPYSPSPPPYNPSPSPYYPSPSPPSGGGSSSSSGGPRGPEDCEGDQQAFEGTLNDYGWVVAAVFGLTVLMETAVVLGRLLCNFSGTTLEDVWLASAEEDSWQEYITANSAMFGLRLLFSGFMAPLTVIDLSTKCAESNIDFIPTAFLLQLFVLMILFVLVCSCGICGGFCMSQQEENPDGETGPKEAAPYVQCVWGRMRSARAFGRPLGAAAPRLLAGPNMALCGTVPSHEH